MDLQGPVVLDAQTLVNLGGQGFQQIVTETVHFVFTGSAQLTYLCQYDGFISGWMNSRQTGIGVSINVDVPSALLSVQGIYGGYVLPPNNSPFVGEWSMNDTMRFPFKINDRINVRCVPASTASVNLYLSRFV